eukprot:UN07631
MRDSHLVPFSYYSSQTNGMVMARNEIAKKASLQFDHVKYLEMFNNLLWDIKLWMELIMITNPTWKNYVLFMMNIVSQMYSNEYDPYLPFIYLNSVFIYGSILSPLDDR